jgi:hypothetical protein
VLHHPGHPGHGKNWGEQQHAIERDWALGVPRRQDPERCGCDDSKRLQDELAAVDRALGVTGQEARLEAILRLLARPTAEELANVETVMGARQKHWREAAARIRQALSEGGV